MKRSLLILSATLTAILALTAGSSRRGDLARAQEPPTTSIASDGAIVIPPSGIAQVPVAVPVPVASDPKTAELVASVCSGDLAEAGYFKIIDPKAFLANLTAEGTGIVPSDWTSVGAQGVVKGRATLSGTTLSLSLRFYEPIKGAGAVLTRDYTGSLAQARGFVHSFDNDLVFLLTGQDGFFGTHLALVVGDGGRKEIYVMDSDGANAYPVTSYGTISILPIWSPTGGELAFTSYLRGNPDLYLVGVGGGHPKRISHFDGINTPGSFSPDGSRLAITLSKGGPINLYTMAPSGDSLTRLTTSGPPIIDTSPTYSPDGSQIAFVSNREGGPQIFVMPAHGGAATRITFAGHYNTEPAWCPRKDVQRIAFTARDEKGAFDVFVTDLQSGALTRLTENQGDNLSPTWAPDGRVLAFHSSRGGVWTMSADGSNQRQISKMGQNPKWGPGLAR